MAFGLQIWPLKNHLAFNNFLVFFKVHWVEILEFVAKLLFFPLKQFFLQICQTGSVWSRCMSQEEFKSEISSEFKLLKILTASKEATCPWTQWAAQMTCFSLIILPPQIWLPKDFREICQGYASEIRRLLWNWNKLGVHSIEDSSVLAIFRKGLQN